MSQHTNIGNRRPTSGATVDLRYFLWREHARVLHTKADIEVVLFWQLDSGKHGRSNRGLPVVYAVLATVRHREVIEA